MSQVKPWSWPSLATILILLLQAPVVTSKCSVKYSGGCGADRSAESTITISLLDDTSGSNVQSTYKATVIFHWGPTDTVVPSQSYKTGDEIAQVENYKYQQGGEYYVGYTVEFGEGSGIGCEGTRYTEYFLASFDDEERNCDFVYHEGTNVPTGIVTDAPSTSSPTKNPTKPPSVRPTKNPTKPPSVRPTFVLAVVATPSPSKPPVPILEPAQDLDLPDLIFPSCGDGICNLAEHADDCEMDCTNILLDVDSEEVASNIEGEYTPGEDVQGAMFSISSQKNIVLTRLTIFSNKISDGDYGVDRVQVYTKVGRYKGFEFDEVAWTSVYDGYVPLLGPSQSTLLNVNNDDGLSIAANSIQSFYIYTEGGISFYQIEDAGAQSTDFVVANDNVLDVYQGHEQSQMWTYNNDNANVLAFRGTLRYNVMKPTTPYPTIAPTVQVTPTTIGSEKTFNPTVISDSRPIPLTNKPTPQGSSTITQLIPKPSPTLAPTISEKIEPTSNTLPLQPSYTEGNTKTKAPYSDPTTALPAASPNSPKESKNLVQFQVQSKMILTPSSLLDESSKQIWRDVTEKTIQESAANLVDLEAKLVDVGVEVDGMLSTKAESLVRNLQVRQSLRNLQASPLEIEFMTTIQFSSEKDDWDGNEMVASGFTTPSKLEKYIENLRTEDENYFASLENIALEVDGKLVTGAAMEPADSTVVQREVSKGNTVPIIAGAVGGACFLLLATAMGMYYTRKRKKIKRQETQSSTTPKEQTHTVAGTRTEVGLQLMDKAYSPKSEEDSPVFGTIESRESDMDDISAIEEPYFDEGGDAGFDNNTVGVSIVSSQHKNHVYGIGAHTQFGGSTAGPGSTVYSGSNRHDAFNDTDTFEDLYRPNPGIANDGAINSSFQRFTVVAPAGLLGIVLDNPNFDLPVVHAIKETSALNGKVKVGDLLLSVDEADCRGMSTSNISLFLSSRSKNPTRTLELVRGSGIDGNLAMDM